ncbi:MAG: MFS transporter [Burkholderiaceae bacterium]|nr:MFS transporter [Burkholderiaceae bacterium]
MPPVSPSARRTRPLLALFVTLGVQMLASLVLSAPSVLAPAVAPRLGFAPERVGLFVGLAYLMAMLSGLWSGRGVASIGAVRLSQAAMFSCALGAFAATGGSTGLLVVAAIAIGTGYGLINPASTTLLERHSPTARRALFFSIKQTGVPLGVALAGLLMPWGLAALGWQWSIALAAVACALLGAALFPTVHRLQKARRLPGPAADADWSAEPLDAAPGVDWPAEPPEAAPGDARAAALAESKPAAAGLNALRSVLRDPALRRLSLTSLAFASTQLVFVTFLVSLLNLQLSHSLAWAAGILAAAQVVSTLSRIALGHAADRWIDAARLLGWLGLAMAASLVALALLRPTTANAWVFAAAIFCAATGMGWNGVYFAELACTARERADLATVAGASQFFTFAGSMSGPVLFAGIIRAGGSYSTGFALFALLPAAAGLALLRARRARRSG